MIVRPTQLLRIGVPVLLGAGTLVSCRNDLDQVAAVEVKAEEPDRITLSAEYQFTDSGRVRNVLKAGRIAEYRTEPPRTELSEGLELVFHDAIGRPGSRLTARRGVILPGEQRMQVFEEVVFTNVKGERLETEALTWSQDSDRVHTERPVKVTRQGDIIFGEGLDAAQDFSRYTIRRITGTLRLPEDDTLVTDAQAE